MFSPLVTQGLAKVLKDRAWEYSEVIYERWKGEYVGIDEQKLLKIIDEYFGVGYRDTEV